MGMTDPIADMLTRIRNASQARHQKVAIPWSRVKENIVKVLIEEGYLKESRKVKAAEDAGEELVIQLNFDRENRQVIVGIKRVSKPSRRVYVGAQAVTPIRHGLGINDLSTAGAVVVEREAQRANVCGELICSVW